MLIVAARFLLGFTLLLACIPKLAAPAAFADAVARYRILPPRAARLAGRGIPICEAALAAGLILGVAERWCAAASAVLLLAFAVAIATNLLRGRAIECACGARPGDRISWRLACRDVLLAGVAVAVAARAPHPAAVTDAIALAAASGLVVLLELLVSELVWPV